MKQFSKELGKVSITPKGDWDSSITNEKLDIVYDRRNNQAYIAKQDVPIGVDIDNREYWQPLNVSGYADNNFINLTAENENGTITAYESLEEAVATIFPINRRVGAILSFYNLNADRLDRQAEFELWQFNSTDLANWENKDYWNNIYYNWNVFAGWYIDDDALKNHVETPNVGQYAYVGSNLNDALLYQCRTNGTWTNTGIKVRNYISVVVKGNITIGENGNWFSDGEDTGIPATPAVDEQIDNIINKHESLSRTVQGIAATGGASTATNVTYNNDASGLNAENAQDAIDELQSSKIDKTSILQESGEAEDKVMSQKAVSDKLYDLSKHIDASIENALSGKYNSISIDGDTLTIKKEGFSLFVLGKRIIFSGTEDKVFTGTDVRTSLYLNPYYLINNTSVNFTENEDVFIEKINSTYNGLLFAEWYQGKLMQTGLVAGFKQLSDTNKHIADTNNKLSDTKKQITDTNNQLFNSNRIQLYCADGNIPYIEEDRTNRKVYVFLAGNICVRIYGSGGITIQQQALADEMGAELTTSPLGKENCFVIDDAYDFVFDLSDGKFKIIRRNDVKANHVVLIVNLGGSVNISESKNFLAQWYDKRINEAEKNIEDFNSYADKGKNIRIRNNVALNSDFKAIFFSDVHGSSENVRRIKEKAISWKSQYVDCILNGGDTVQAFNSEGLDWYNRLVQDSTIPFIPAVGNHDAWSTNFWTWDSNENIYNLLTSKVKEYVPSIVQPADVNTTHANYYYYDTEKVRVIVLLSLTSRSSDVYYDEAQDTWLKSVLADAKENNKAVIIMNHGPIDPKDCEEIECNWTSKFSWVNDVGDKQHMDNRILENVDSFIDSGGKFICYLAGHSHLDYILRSKKHPRQMCLVITSARYNLGSDCTRSQSKDNIDYDSYNYIGVDLTHSVIKVQRIGMNTNAWMQEHSTMCWDFKNSKLISVN